MIEVKIELTGPGANVAAAELPMALEDVRDSGEAGPFEFNITAAAEKETRSYPHGYLSEELAPVEVSLATLDVITEAQRNRLCELIRSYQADTATLFRDTFGEGKNLGFALYKGREKNLASVIVNGLIEPDGRCHT